MSESVSPQVMYDVANLDSATCSTVSTDLQDVVYRFDVDAASAGTYDFDTVGSQSTTYLSLHRGAPDTLTSVTPSLSTRSLVATDDTTANSSPTGAQSGLSLGAVDGKTVTYADATTATTSNKWTDAQFAGCRVSPANNAAHEHVLSFSVASTSTVTITLNQTAPFDASVAGSTQTNLKACSRVSGGSSANPAGFSTAANGVLTGTLTAGTYYVMVHGYQTANNTGSYGGCKADCSLAPYCGDGRKDAAFGEQCDDGMNVSTYGGCGKGCILPPRCGDGTVQAEHGEKCDDGNTKGGDGCSPVCTNELL